MAEVARVRNTNPANQPGVKVREGSSSSDALEDNLCVPVPIPAFVSVYLDFVMAVIHSVPVSFFARYSAPCGVR